MSNLRLITRLDIKGPNLIKGIHLEGLRVIGDPYEYAMQYYQQGADELIYMDTVASLYCRNNLSEILERAAQNIFIPLTVGGGIRSVEDAKHLLRCGADKIAINTAAVKNPSLITELANHFGSQSVVLSIEAKQVQDGRWEAYTDNGREHTGLDVLEWAEQGVSLGAGEVLLTSVDNEGTRKGFDQSLIAAMTKCIDVPLIVSGGMGEVDHLISLYQDIVVDAVAMADILHYQRATIPDIRRAALAADLPVRVCE